MGTISKSYSETKRGANFPSATLATHTFTFTKNDVKASANKFTVGTLSCGVKYDIGNSGRTGLDDILRVNYKVGSGALVDYGLFKTNIIALNANTLYSLELNTNADYQFNTADFFNSNNPNDRSVGLYLYAKRYKLSTGQKTSSGLTIVGYTDLTDVDDLIGAVCDVVLDVPPTCTVSVMSYDTGYVYAGLTTASVTISDAAAYYDGTVSSITLTIGSQTDTRSGNGTLSIALDTPGTFTPTVTITDSRGQTKTYTLPAITVNTYTAPTVSFDVDRTDSTGTPDDEGTYGLIEATLTFADAVADAVAPSVVLTDENGTQTTPTVTWYTDDTLQTTVTWANVSSGDTVYGLFSGLNTNYSYTVSVRPRDTQGTGTSITQTISAAFYTVDFLAGGHGIAFGQPSRGPGFYCNMDAHFVDANSTMRALFDFIYPVGSYYETSDTAFDPNVTWGGTWALETEGQVHVSGSVNGTYQVSGAPTDTSDGGEATHQLTIDEMPSHNHNPSGQVRWYDSTNHSNALTNTSNNRWWYTNLSNLIQSQGGGQAHNNMQPYIIVNRWHRTA